MKTTSLEADDLCKEASAVLRAALHAHLTKKILAGELPDMMHTEVFLLADFASNKMHELMFPFLDGGELPQWMLPSNAKSPPQR